MAMAMLTANKGHAPNGSVPTPQTHPSASRPSSSLPVSLTTTTYPQAKYQEIVGTISLTDESLTFQPAEFQSTAAAAGTTKIEVVPWSKVMKHQYSPISHPKCLLKISLHPTSDDTITTAADTTTKKKKKKKRSLTFELRSRAELDRIRRDIAGRLSDAAAKSSPSATATTTANGSSKKRPHSDLSPAASAAPAIQPTLKKSMLSASFTDLDPDALAVTRSSLLSSNPTLRAQHALLVTETKTLSEDDFWVTHSQTLSDEYAKIYGKIRAGMPSSIKSNLDLGLRGRVKLGVEEMRQIFIMYPAVHRAYEAKVPLELSEEQFWRKYLESEYFHRDRGRIGSHVGKVNQLERSQKEKFEKEIEENKGNKGNKSDDKKEDDEPDEAAARSRAMGGTDDIFSRYDKELEEMSGGNAASAAEGNEAAAAGTKAPTNTGAQSPTSVQNNNHQRQQNRWESGIKLAVGQFDLAATAQTERGSRILNALDLHPSPANDSKGARVVDKYNRHWAMVLHPDDATAGCDLKKVAKRSVYHVLEGDEDAKVNGGVDDEMRRLVSFAEADEENADHAKGIGDVSGSKNNKQGDDDENGENESALFQELSLRNVEAYSGEVLGSAAPNRPKLSTEEELKRKMFEIQLGKHTAAQVRASTGPLIKQLANSSNGSGRDGINDYGGNGELEKLDGAFPPPDVGVMILGALTSKMASDSKTEADIQKMASKLSEDFKKRLTSFFRRSSELLRHFFGLRRVMGIAMVQQKQSSGFEVQVIGGDDNDGAKQQKTDKDASKLQRIVQGMEAVYREMEVMRKELPQSDNGEIMRKMCLPIMDQLDWAFQLHRESQSGGGGGFVTVEEL